MVVHLLDTSRLDRWVEDGWLLVFDTLLVGSALFGTLQVRPIVLARRKHTVDKGGTLFETVANRTPRTTKDGRIEVPIEITLVPREGGGS